ncbi:YggS family pyridoxal phosphate-dependent enzyme [Sphaerisporangium sp. TRM90804]|uniref:YggS family pyridoxal phosphate-dependent enzyme n=1 Tax=Sphaerisporangium sp. TRM90804 TaxID=3031113 RepID=UPI00244B6942|nr:YggS family pyridoxal phosphate-dependent enzyme [Sphaerisporangium sp. TRM90804]MDH2428607.1 YggS family pyridoxal phosphate-dependent enzyme [Sphaerisporangium sp. TRM90804]
MNDPEITRRDQIAAGLAEVERRIAAACEAAGRARDEITLIAVTKTYPASDVGVLAALGVRDVGENRDQEAAAKVADCSGLPLRWHFVGQLQTNKARSVVGYADMVHSVDRARLATALDREALAAGRRLTCLVQVALDDDPARGGVPAAGLPALAAAIEEAEGLVLGGLMAVAPLGADPSRAFARLEELSRSLRERYPHATAVSAGMSGDLAEAIAHGATHVRVGTALLGRRKAFVR